MDFRCWKCADIADRNCRPWAPLSHDIMSLQDEQRGRAAGHGSNQARTNSSFYGACKMALSRALEAYNEQAGKS